MRTPLILLLAAAILFPACVSTPVEAPPAVLLETEFGEALNTHSFGTILTAGQLSRADLEYAQGQQVRTIVTLRTEGELEWNERDVVTDLGMTFVEIPFRAPDTLTDDIFERGRLVLENAEQPLIMHCGSANRVGAIWLAWRVLDGGLSVEEAQLEAKAVGLKTPEYEARALDYITRMQG